MGSKTPIQELTETKRELTTIFPFTCPVVKDRKIEISVHDKHRDELREYVEEKDLTIESVTAGKRTAQGVNNRVTITP